jgi:phosphorylcholine metabolism protein LicD
MADRRFGDKKNVSDALDVLKKLISALDKYDIKYYLDFGTLLGAVRDKGLIPWDDDIDISILKKNDYNKIQYVLKELNDKYKLRTYIYTFKESLNKFHKKCKIHTNQDLSFVNSDNLQIAKVRNNIFWIFGRGNVSIDIFFKYKYNNNLFWFADGKSNKIPSKIMQDELIKINFYDLECYIPKNYDEYLTALYGDWKTPNKDWIEDDSITQI